MMESGYEATQWPAGDDYNGMMFEQDGMDPNILQSHISQYVNYQQPSPASTSTYTDLSPPLAYDMASYLPTQPPVHQNTLPDLGLDVASIFDQNDVNNSLDRLTLDASNALPALSSYYINGDPQLYNGVNGNGSMSSGSNGSASLTNGMHNGVVGANNAHVAVRSPHHIQILEQPMEFGYRFRYEVEGKAHGGLQGQSSKCNGSKRAAKIYPEIQVCGVPSDVDEVEIEARLVSATEDYYPHPNKCSGKDCNPSGIFRKILKRTEDPEFKLLLNNLTVLQIKKGDQKESLKDQLKDIAMQGCDIRLRQISTPELENKAEELSKAKHNGVVRIRFQASFVDKAQNCYQVAYAHSKPVHDQKQTNAAELRICRVSAHSAPVTGSCTEIYLLCEKVTKEDIKVKFKHDNWEADGVFNGVDVHYQYAIVFKAPPYKNLDIQKDVKVEMMLFRPSTSTYSKPLVFTYTPIQTEFEEVARKRKRPSGPSDMGGYPPYSRSPFDHFGPGPSSGGGGGRDYYLSGSPSGYNGRPRGHQRSTHSPAAVTEAKASGEEEMAVDLSKPKHDNIPITIGTEDEVEADCIDEMGEEIEEVEADSIAAAHPVIKKEKCEAAAKSLIVKVEPSTEKTDSDDDLQTDGCPDARKTTAVMPTPQLPKDTMGSHISKLLVGDTKKFTSEIQPMAPVKKARTGSKQPKTGRAANPDPLASMKKELEMEKTKREQAERHVSMCEDLVVQSLMNYAVTGDHLYFISQFRYFLGANDEYGDNSLHMAVINGQPKALRDMLSICVATSTTTSVNQLNDKQQTPLHIATIIKDTEMVELLLNHQANPTIADRNGNNCFHVAAKNKDFRTLELLCRWLRLSNRDPVLLDEFNYEGYTALHRAVQADAVECIRELTHSGVSIDKGDATSGKTALHHAVQRSNIITTLELLLQAKADVNTQAFDGNTSLHIAVCLKNENLTKMLIKSGADPLIKNREHGMNHDDDEEEESIGLTAYDMCHEDEHMLEVIETALVREKKQTLSEDLIQSLPKYVTERLSLLLDQDSHDWKRLAKLFELSSLIDYMEDKTTPTLILLNYLARNDKTIKDLTDGLRRISRQDCVEVIERLKPSGRHESIKDSGFLESVTSGNLKSEN